MTMFNEPESYLIRQWGDVRALEDAAKIVRTKFVQIFEEVLDEVWKSHRELNSPWTKYLRYGNVGLGKKAWLLKPGSYSGFWIQNIGLANLTAQDQEPPYKYVTIENPSIDLKEAMKRLRTFAEKTLPKEEFDRAEFDSNKTEAWLGIPLKEPRDKLVDLLLKDGGRDFIRCMIDHFEWMTKFTPVLDAILSAGKKVRK